jgi:hypothetical protein
MIEVSDEKHGISLTLYRYKHYLLNRNYREKYKFNYLRHTSFEFNNKHVISYQDSWEDMCIRLISRKSKLLVRNIRSNYNFKYDCFNLFTYK